MKILYLLRHAHAEDRGTSLSDFDRPLKELGLSEAQAVATYIKTKGLSFDFVMCSAALRTQQTLEPLRSVIGTTDIEISENFYNSPEDKILKNLQKISDDWNKVLYIGHNPGIAFAAFKFTKTFPEVLIEGVTPGTLIGFQLPIDHWVDLEWWEGEVIDVFQPETPPSAPPAQEGS
ncbi:MAG: histidine phosphatase family protein [Alphaproteobacteria bacterium]|nr:histidine phosphatase family protein [Alphaproteobacteria bacterium]